MERLPGSNPALSVGFANLLRRCDREPVLKMGIPVMCHLTN
jgi:hypothetical protein